MMTQQLGFSVLSAPIAALDRRALSQAWFSALHLAHERKPQSACLKQTVAPKAHAAGTLHGAPPSRTRTAQSAMTIHRTVRPARLQPSAIDRRAMRSPLARKIEHTFLRPAKRVERATFSLEESNARVHVSLQKTASGMQLVAVCAPRVRDAVARALNEARYALAARGIALDARVAE